MISDKIRLTAEKFRQHKDKLCVLTGAGVSAESGIRTFRGKDGYWTVGSSAYTPQEMATKRMFSAHPEESWKWYLMRFLICRDSEPNDGHYALTELSTKLGNRLSLITQNIDGLHLKAAFPKEHCYQIHGSINHMRCSRNCCPDLFPLPFECVRIHHSEDFESVREVLICPKCQAMSRPHILWFDEYYTEKHYRADSAVEVAQESDLLIVAGTTLLTTLPSIIVEDFVSKGKPVINIDIEEGTSAQLAERTPGGGFIHGSSAQALRELSQLLF